LKQIFWSHQNNFPSNGYSHLGCSESELQIRNKKKKSKYRTLPAMKIQFKKMAQYNNETPYMSTKVKKKKKEKHTTIYPLQFRIRKIHK
jgi:hypothetical protein